MPGELALFQSLDPHHTPTIARMADMQQILLRQIYAMKIGEWRCSFPRWVVWSWSISPCSQGLARLRTAQVYKRTKSRIQERRCKQYILAIGAYLRFGCRVQQSDCMHPSMKSTGHHFITANWNKRHDRRGAQHHSTTEQFTMVEHQDSVHSFSRTSQSSRLV